MSQHDDIRQLLPLFVLGALEQTSDCDRVCSHLATGCLSCTAELAEHARSASQLALTADPVKPRAELREKLRKALAGASATTVSELPGKVVRLPLRTPQRLLAAATAVAAAAVICAFYFNDAARREQLRASEAVARLGAEEQHEKELAQRLKADHDVVEALQGPSKVFELAAQKDQQGSARVVWDTASRRWILLATGLKPVPPGKGYELWFIAEGKPPVGAEGTFAPGPDGQVRHVWDLPPGMERIDLGAITLEPSAGSLAPTSPIVLAGKVS